MTEFSELMARRWSCRAFLPDPLPPEVLRAILTDAIRSPSWCNTQAWNVHLLSGAALSRFTGALVAAVRNDPSAGRPDAALPSYAGVHLDRRRASGFALYDSVGIDRYDRAARAEQMLRNFDFFGAPHAAIVHVDRAHGFYGGVDTGVFLANLCNSALSRGVATIMEGAIGVVADLVHDLLDLPDDRLIVAGVALGRPDLAHPANRFRTERAGYDEIVTELAE